MDPNLIKVNKLIFTWTIWIFVLLWSLPSISFAETNDTIDKGHSAFQQQNFEESLKIYRRYLRDNPKSYDIWNLLGASYYHNGQPKPALIALKKGLEGSKLKSQNYYYQGLCYSAINQPNRAKINFKKSAKSDDSFAPLGILELVSLNNDLRDFQEARKWISEFKKRFPKHALIPVISRIELDMDAGLYIPIKESQIQKYNESIFRNHELSLMPTPHFWFFQTGLDYASGTHSNPAYRGTPIVETGAGFEESLLKLSAGFGLGPLHKGDSEIHLGYYYTQDWFTNTQRMKTYFDDPSDFTYFPYRPDLQKREHRLFVEFRTSLNEKIDLGLYGDLTFVRSGSKIYPAPERPEIRQSTDLTQGNSLIPWIAWNFNPHHSVYSYLYLKKNINLEQSENSWQSYAIFSSSSDPFFSFSLGYSGDFFKEKLKFNFETFQYRFLTNDYWDEYQRVGFKNSLSYRLFDSIVASVNTMIYNDNYIYDQIKSGSCDFGDNSFGDGVTCPRTDSGYALGGGISYQPSQHQAISGYISLKKHTNPELKVYDEERLELYAIYTLAFPSVDKVSRYIGGLHDSFKFKEVK